MGGRDNVDRQQPETLLDSPDNSFDKLQLHARIMRARYRLVLMAGGFSLLFGAIGVKLATVMLIEPLVNNRLHDSVLAGYVFLQIPLAAANILAAYGLYRLRCRAMSIYGRLEIVVGMIAAILIGNQLFGAAVPGLLTIFIAEIGALYVMVRGLDNIYRSMSPSRYRDYWEIHFFGQAGERS